MACSAHGFILAASLGTLELEGCFASSDSYGSRLGLEAGLCLCVGVESHHGNHVLKRVLLGGACGNVALLNYTELALDLVGVDDACEVGDSHAVAVQLVSSLLNTLLTVSSKDLVQVSECILGENHKAAEMTTRSKLQEIQTVN